MITYVIDACALIAYLFDEEGSELFENLLFKARNNEIEMIRFENRISDQMVYKIGELKPSYRISYADAFAVAQAILSNAELNNNGS